MVCYIKYEGKKRYFFLPTGWDLISDQDNPPESAADSHRRLIEDKIPDHLRSFGISYIMQVLYFKELAEKFSVYPVTEGLSPEQVRTMKFFYATDPKKAIDQISSEMPKADAAIFPSGGNIIPEVR